MEAALAALKQAFGAQSKLRSGQWSAIEPLLQGGCRQLVVQRTGWGKSVVYFLATRLIRDAGRGPTLIVSPLLALMRNQIEMAERFGLRAASINSTNVGDWPSLESKALEGQVDVLLVSPERLANRGFRERVLPAFLGTAGLLVIDEAHCISDWGHDFRPDYRRILGLVGALNPEASVLATTATANIRVIQDLRDHFGPDLRIQRGPLERESLRLSAFLLDDHAERLAWLAKYLPRFPGTGIVYTLTVSDAEQVAKWLQKHGIDARAYHSEVPDLSRRELEHAFSENRLKALVATTALGMGYDKVDVAFVVHYQMPGSAIAYYQQVGRAGRSLSSAYGVLLAGEEDEEVTEHFIDSAFPARWVFETLLTGIRSGTRSLSECLSSVPVPPPVIRHALEVLEAEDIVEQTSEGFAATGKRDALDWDRIEGVREQRRQELRQMREYVRHDGCRMEFLERALSDPQAGKCGRCDNCKPHAPIALPEELVEEARAFLRSSAYAIKPHTRLPKGFDLGRARTLRKEELLLEGVALSSYNDPGWGRMVRDGKYESLQFSAELVQASADAVRKTGFKPEWLTWVPSSKHGTVVESFARRLAEALGVEAVEAVRRVESRRPQKTMGTSTAQFLNAWGAFEATDVRDGPCLLVDDVVDSGWTLTVIGLELYGAGSGPIMPFALATAKPRKVAF